MIDDDAEIEQYTRDQAFELAQAEAMRDFTDHGASISYVAFVSEFSEFEDYCFCEFVQHEGAWIKVIRGLLNHERRPGEEIRDARIVELAHAGNLIGAIRLYRTKYQVGLVEGKAGVEALLRED